MRPMTSAPELISYGVAGRGPEGLLYLVLRLPRRSQSNSALRSKPAARIHRGGVGERDTPGRQSIRTAAFHAREESPALFLRAVPWHNEGPCAKRNAGFEAARLQNLP